MAEASAGGYAVDGTVIAFDLSPPLRDMLDSICRAQEIQVCHTTCLTDLVAVPGFLMVCDFSRCEPGELLEHYSWFLEVAGRDDRFLLTGTPPVPPPGGLRRHIIRTPRRIDESFLASLIFHRHRAVRRRLRAVRRYELRLSRLFYIVRAFERRTFLTTRDLCGRFHISERTVARDMDLLATMGEPISYDARRKRYTVPSRDRGPG